MESIAIIGAGGFGREVHYLLKCINRIQPVFDLVGFFDDDKRLAGIINGLPLLGAIEDVGRFKTIQNAVVAISGNAQRSRISMQLIELGISMPNIVSPGIVIDETVEMGWGNIICQGCLLTCNISIGNCNVFNGKVNVGHDVVIGNYNLLGPNSFLSGEVRIGSYNVLNMNSSIIQGIRVGDHNKINMNSVLIRSIESNGVYFGVPATRMEY